MEYGCIGQRLPHSFSRTIHEKIGGYDYVLKELDPAELADFMAEHDFLGINVTIPYKQAVIPYLQELSPAAAKIGAVNTVMNRGGRLCGFNTDHAGMIALAKKAEISFAGKKVLILGSGGTAKTADAAARDLGAAEIRRVSRTAKEGALSYAEAVRQHADADIIINTTPVGMYPQADAAPIDLSPFSGLSGLLDAVYNPLRTRLVLDAKRRGINAAGGLYMLVAQAVRAAELFTGSAYGQEVIDRIYDEVRSAKEDLVLIGMPGSGKTTVGRALAEKLGREFIDTDKLIEEKAGMAITDIFASRGETAFRDLESAVIKEAAARTGCVIATGGGAVLRESNTDALRGNGKIIFLDRAPDCLVPTADRPLADTAEKMRRLYEERYPLYEKAADLRINTENTPDEAVWEIMRWIK